MSLFCSDLSLIFFSLFFLLFSSLPRPLFISIFFFFFNRPADDGAFDKFLWIFGMPFVALFTITVPDCSKTKGEKYYIVTFIMSIAWIGGLCTAMVMGATWIGCIIGIDPIVMGITL